MRSAATATDVPAASGENRAPGRAGAAKLAQTAPQEARKLYCFSPYVAAGTVLQIQRGSSGGSIKLPHEA